MIVSTQTLILAHKFGYEKALEIIKNAGFAGFDLSLFRIMNDDDIFNQPDYLERAKDLRNLAEKTGLICNQSHAPFPTSFGDERDGDIFKKIVRAMEVASIVGAKIIVVHPKQHLIYADNISELEELNINFYKSLIPYSEKFGIKVALENMWQPNPYSNAISDSTCSRPKEFCRYIDRIGHPNFAACLDIGHVPLAGAKTEDLIIALGPRLQALHIHDNGFLRDEHTLPFTRKINFDEICKALAHINYQGDITFEADDGFIAPFPDDLMPSAERLMCSVGNYLKNEILKYQNR